MPPRFFKPLAHIQSAGVSPIAAIGFVSVGLTVMITMATIVNTLVAGQFVIAASLASVVRQWWWIASIGAVCVGFLVSIVFPLSFFIPLLSSSKTGIVRLVTVGGMVVFGVSATMAIHALPLYLLEALSLPIQWLIVHRLTPPYLPAGLAILGLGVAFAGVGLALYLGLRAPFVVRDTVSVAERSVHDTKSPPDARDDFAPVHATETLPASSLTIAHLTDLHLGMMRGRAWMERLAGQVNALEPDVIAISGDINDNDLDAFKPVAPALNKLRPKLKGGLVACSGNHDLLFMADEWVSCMKDVTNVNVLANDAVDLGPVIVAGVHDFRGKGTTSCDQKAALCAVDALPPKPVVWLQHQPTGLDAVDAHPNVKVILSGHTHNGQFWPFRFAVMMRYRFIHGLYRLARGTTLIVGAGTGSWGPPMRVFTKAEIRLVTLNW